MMETMEVIEIKITTNEDGIRLVSARELYEFLQVKHFDENKGKEVGSRFNDWIKNRIEKYGFEENIDYTKILVQCIRGQNEYDYAVTIDMAKELCMVENNKLGRQARRYFIEKEKEAKVLNTIIDNTTDENAKLERNRFRFSTKRTINTFRTCNPLKLPYLCTEFIDYIKEDLSTSERLTRYTSAIKGISESKLLLDCSTIHLLSVIQNEELRLTKEKSKLENRHNGGVKGSKTQEINKLENEVNVLKEQLERHNPSDKKFTWVNHHLLSENYMYTYKEEIHRLVKSDAYKRWLANFPYNELMGKEEMSNKVDFTKPMGLVLKIVIKNEMDAQNMKKAIIDLIANQYGFNDILIEECKVELIGRCQNYNQGSFGYYLYNL